MTPISIARGESLLVPMTLQDSSGAALNFSSLSSYTVEVLNGGVVMTPTTSDYLQAIGANLNLNIPASVTAGMQPGLYSIRLTLKISDTSYFAEASIRTAELTFAAFTLR